MHFRERDFLRPIRSASKQNSGQFYALLSTTAQQNGRTKMIEHRDLENENGPVTGAVSNLIYAPSASYDRIMPALSSSVALVLCTPSRVTTSWNAPAYLTETVEPAAPSVTFTTSAMLENF